MRRGLIALLGLAAIAVPFAAHGNEGQGNGPPSDRLTGSGRIAFADFPLPGETTVEQIEVSAHSGPNGQDPHGVIVVHSPFADGPQTAEVTCLVANGNHAVAGATFEEPIDYLGLRIKHLSLIVTDNGSEDTATGFSFIDRPRPPGFSPCTFLAPTTNQVIQGNYVVADGSGHGGGRFR